MGLKFFMAPHKFSMLVTIEGYKVRAERERERERVRET
jgi:hypothetical protein